MEWGLQWCQERAAGTSYLSGNEEKQLRTVQTPASNFAGLAAQIEGGGEVKRRGGLKLLIAGLDEINGAIKDRKSVV